MSSLGMRESTNPPKPVRDSVSGRIMWRMERVDIEPGLLRLFRWFVALRLGWLVLLDVSGQNRTAEQLLFVPKPGIVIFGLLLVYLFATPLQERLGKWYLPLALWITTIGLLVENGITVARRLATGATPNQAVSDYWVLFFLLFVPLILLAWQYRYRWVVLFAVGTFFLDAVLTMGPLDGTTANLRLIGALLLGRAGLFLFVGLVIVKLVGAQRAQRKALADFAATRERLATSEERSRLARELHDTLAHTLSAVAVQLEGARSLWDDDPNRARAMVDRSLESTRAGLTDARRLIQALRASPLDDHGLVIALEQLCTSVSESSSVAAVLDAQPVELEPQVEHAAYRIATEALTNATRHSGAQHAVVRVRQSNGTFLLAVQDDGTGFDEDEAGAAGRHGIRGMRERAALIGGALRITPRRNGGTVVELRVSTGA